MHKIYLISILFMFLKNVYSQTNENFQYVPSLPSATVVAPTKLPESNLAKAFNEGYKNSLPQSNKGDNIVPKTDSETLDEIADRLNNTPTNVNYTPNQLAPIEVPVDVSEYKDIELSLADVESKQLKEIVAIKKEQHLKQNINEIADSTVGKVTISLFQFCIYILCISVLIAFVLFITNSGERKLK